MHSKHDRPHSHTMSPNYKPQNPAHRRLPPRNTTWPEQQANLILGLRDMCGVACNTPDSVVEEFDADRQIHARWTDPDLVSALSQMRDSLPGKGKLLLQFGGRDVTEATWVTVHQEKLSPDTGTELKYVLWFHEYDDLDVEVGELRDVDWGVKKEEDVEVKVEDLEMEDVDAKMKPRVKLEMKKEDSHGMGT